MTREEAKSIVRGITDKIEARKVRNEK